MSWVNNQPQSELMGASDFGSRVDGRKAPSKWVSLPVTGSSGSCTSLPPSEFPRIQAEHDAAWAFKQTHGLCIAEGDLIK